MQCVPVRPDRYFLSVSHFSLSTQRCSQYSTSPVPVQVPVLRRSSTSTSTRVSSTTVSTSILEIGIMVLLKTAEVEVSNALLFKSE